MLFLDTESPLPAKTYNHFHKTGPADYGFHVSETYVSRGSITNQTVYGHSLFSNETGILFLRYS